jgi:hypothetical protein
MIARLWKGWTTLENADAYERHLREDLLPSLRQRINGYRGDTCCGKMGVRR